MHKLTTAVGYHDFKYYWAYTAFKTHNTVYYPQWFLNIIEVKEEQSNKHHDIKIFLNQIL